MSFVRGLSGRLRRRLGWRGTYGVGFALAGVRGGGLGGFRARPGVSEMQVPRPGVMRPEMCSPGMAMDPRRRLRDADGQYNRHRNRKKPRELKPTHAPLSMPGRVYLVYLAGSIPP